MTLTITILIIIIVLLFSLSFLANHYQTRKEVKNVKPTEIELLKTIPASNINGYNFEEYLSIMNASEYGSEFEVNRENKDAQFVLELYEDILEQGTDLDKLLIFKRVWEIEELENIKNSIEKSYGKESYVYATALFIEAMFLFYYPNYVMRIDIMEEACKFYSKALELGKKDKYYDRLPDALEVAKEKLENWKLRYSICYDRLILYKNAALDSCNNNNKEKALRALDLVFAYLKWLNMKDTEEYRDCVELKSKIEAMPK